MNLDEIQALWDEDSKLDQDELHIESTKIPSLHAKYYKIYNNLTLLKKVEEIKLKQTKKEKWLYYKGKAPSSVYKEMPFDFKLTTKEEINMFIESDDDIMKLQYRIDYIEQTLLYLDSVLRMINNRNFQIKNAIDWEKFKNGF